MEFDRRGQGRCLFVPAFPDVYKEGAIPACTKNGSCGASADLPRSFAVQRRRHCSASFSITFHTTSPETRRRGISRRHDEIIEVIPENYVLRSICDNSIATSCKNIFPQKTRRIDAHTVQTRWPFFILASDTIVCICTEFTLCCLTDTLTTHMRKTRKQIRHSGPNM